MASCFAILSNSNPLIDEEADIEEKKGFGQGVLA